MVAFTKVQGLGNDFVLVDARAEGAAPFDGEAARAICDRRRGVGADGVLTLLPPREGGDLALLIQNSDGSVPEMCGNGLRCVIRYLAGEGAEGRLQIETGAGARHGWVEPSGAVTVTLGSGRVLADVPVSMGEVELRGVEVTMGNPHLVCFLEASWLAGRSLDAVADQYGPELEHHPHFPDRVNVGFAALGAEGFDLVVFERGAGRTEACGTGAGACALAAIHTGRAKPGPVHVRLPGGRLRVGTPEAEGAPVLLSGGAELVFTGQWG